MHLVVGTYERFLLGYSVPDALEGSGGALPRAFTHASHQGPVRSVDAAGAYVVSGGADDQLHLYDVKRGRDLGFLMNPGEGAVPCLQLFTPPGAAAPSHLFSGSADGGIAIWAAGGEWQHLKMMKGHKGAVNALSVHPSGRLALSVAHDKQLRMWDLLRGRCTYTAALDAEGLDLRFGPTGATYALLTPTVVTLHAAGGEGGLLARVDSPEVRFTTVGRGAQDDRVVLLGQDDGSLCLWDVRTGRGGASAGAGFAARVEKAHKTRLRAIVAVTPDPGAALPRHIATASSDGAVRIWDCRMLGGGGGGGGSGSGCRELCCAETGARITCMALSAPGRHQPALASDGGGGDGGEAAEADQAQAKQKQQPAAAKKKKKAGGIGAAAAAAQEQHQQRAGGRRDRGQQGLPGGSSDEEGGGGQAAAQRQHRQQNGQQKRQQQQQQQQQRPGKQQKKHSKPASPAAGAGAGAGAAPAAGAKGKGGGDQVLVPRVQTIIKKKKAGPGAAAGRPHAGGRASGGGGGSSGGGGGISIVSRKAPRGARG